MTRTAAGPSSAGSRAVLRSTDAPPLPEGPPRVQVMSRPVPPRIPVPLLRSTGISGQFRQCGTDSLLSRC